MTTLFCQDVGESCVWLPQIIIPASGQIMLVNHLSSAALIWETEANERISSKIIRALLQTHASPGQVSVRPCPPAEDSTPTVGSFEPPSA